MYLDQQLNIKPENRGKCNGIYNRMRVHFSAQWWRRIKTREWDVKRHYILYNEIRIINERLETAVRSSILLSRSHTTRPTLHSISTLTIAIASSFYLRLTNGRWTRYKPLTFEWTMANVSTQTLQPPYSCLIAWWSSILKKKIQKRENNKNRKRKE